MSQISGDIHVKKGHRLMIRSWDFRSQSEVVTGPYFTLSDFYVYEKFIECLHEYGIAYQDSRELQHIMNIHRDIFVQWLINECYLDVEPKDVLSLDVIMQLEHTEDDRI